MALHPLGNPDRQRAHVIVGGGGREAGRVQYRNDRVSHRQVDLAGVLHSRMRVFVAEDIVADLLGEPRETLQVM